MLQSLYIKNIALISEANIIFDDGLNVLSGETGSGKSVILDSINFVLGSKADRTMIRYGENEAIVKAEFSVGKNSEAARMLEEYDIDADDTIIISRKLTADGKNSIKINGNPVTVSMLKNITVHLVDVHGQSEHFFLFSEKNQLKLLDDMLGDSSEKIKAQLEVLIKENKEYKKLITGLGGSEAERAAKLDLLEYQISEIEAADIKIGEFDELSSKRNIILNVEKILNSLNISHEALSADGGFSDGLITALHEINKIKDFDSGYEKLASRLENLYADATDIAEEISDFSENLTFDQTEADNIEERLSLIKNLKRKYGADEEEILKFKDRAKEEFEAISNSSELIDKYNKTITINEDKIFALCLELTKLRKEEAEKFCSKVVDELKTLNIPHAKFSVEFKEYDRSSANLQSVDGCDDICFYFSANSGEPLKPLNKVISGGEMSRFMLAVKTRLKDLNGISTYIFDEIDAGISGYTAGTVATKFREISRHTQILAVSHLPQVCAASDAQFLIYKIEDGGKTLTKVKKLTDEEKVEEVMRLTGSINSDYARLHAKELIKEMKN